MTRRIRGSGGTFEPSKIHSQIRRAYEHAGSSARSLNALVKPLKTEFSPEKLKAVASRMPDVDEKWLAARSPIAPATATSAQFLEALYDPGEKVIVFTVFKSPGQCVFEVGTTPQSRLPDGGPDGVWFFPTR